MVRSRAWGGRSFGQRLDDRRAVVVLQDAERLGGRLEIEDAAALIRRFVQHEIDVRALQVGGVRNRSNYLIGTRPRGNKSFAPSSVRVTLVSTAFAS